MNSHFSSILLPPQSTSIEVSPFDSPSPDAKFTVDGMSIDTFEPPARGSAFMFYSKAGNGRGSGMDSHVEYKDH